MKQIFLIVSMFVCLIQVKAQLKADAGNDIVLCFSDSASSTAQLGGLPVASGGVEPYTYTWSGKIVQYFGPEDSTWVYASYFLDDTTKSHPTFKRGPIPFDWPTFKLEVKDAVGNVQYDSIKIIDGSIWSLLIYMPPRTITRGDSVQFYGDINYQNCDMNFKFLPLKYQLSPDYGITDPTDLHGWAKPGTSTTYYLQVTNSVGCVTKAEYLRVIVDTTTVSAVIAARQTTQCYLSHGDLVINLPQSWSLPFQINVATINGALIHTGTYRDRNLRLANLNLKRNQVYFLSVIEGGEKQTVKVFSE